MKIQILTMTSLYVYIINITCKRISIFQSAYIEKGIYDILKFLLTGFYAYLLFGGSHKIKKMGPFLDRQALCKGRWGGLRTSSDHDSEAD